MLDAFLPIFLVLRQRLQVRMDVEPLLVHQAFRFQFPLHIIAAFGRAFAPVATGASQLKVLTFVAAAIALRLDVFDFQIKLVFGILASIFP